MNSRTLTSRWSDLDRDATLELQGHALHRYLRDCVLPFSANYRRVFEEQGLSADDFKSVEDLTQLPFTSKEDLLPTPENPRRALDFALVPQPEVLSRRPGVIARALWRGRARVRDELDREWRPTFMTATTGRSTESVPFLYTQHDLHNLAVGGGRIIQIGRVARDERIMNLFPFAPHLAFWCLHYAGMHENTFVLSTGGGKCAGTTGNLRAILRLKPRVLVAMPTFAYHLLQQAVEEGHRIEGVRIICLGGEKVADGMRRKLVDLCAQVGSPNVQVMATYGFTEAKMAWTECPVGSEGGASGYHLYPDMGIVEVVDPKTGTPVPDGTRGEIVWTPLRQRGTVVLRYRTGDIIENGLAWGTCPCCGRSLPRLMGRISRLSEFRALRFQKVKGTIVDFNDLEHALDDVEGVGAWQIELRKMHDDPLDVDEVVLHITRCGDAPEAAVDRHLRELLQARFELRPNRITFHTPEQMKELHQVGVALKEAKVVDNRPKAAAEPVAPTAARPALEEAHA